MFLSSLLSAYAVEQFEPFAKWISVGVIALLLIVGAVIFFIKKPIAINKNNDIIGDKVAKKVFIIVCLKKEVRQALCRHTS